MRGVPTFVDVFASDTLPDIKIPIPSLFIVNTDSQFEPGEHWISISLLPGGKAEFFNSFGLPPLVPAIAEFLTTHAPNNLKYSNVCLQDAETEVCGLYCIAFCKHVAGGGALDSFIGQFTHMRGQIAVKNEELLARLLQSQS